jgi:hypothetical protein
VVFLVNLGLLAPIRVISSNFKEEMPPKAPKNVKQGRAQSPLGPAIAVALEFYISKFLADVENPAHSNTVRVVSRKQSLHGNVPRMKLHQLAGPFLSCRRRPTRNPYEGTPNSASVVRSRAAFPKAPL